MASKRFDKSLAKINPCIERLILCTSSDETRFHLTYLHQSKELGMVVSTDGHRMYASKGNYRPDLAGKTFEADIFGLHNRWLEADMGPSKYPNVAQFCPDDSKMQNCVKVQVPKWIGAFKNKKEMVAITLDIGPDGSRFQIAGGKTTDTHISFNAALMAFLAGEEVFISWKDDKSPMIFQPSNPCETSFRQDEWFLLLMPMRRGDTAHVVIKKQNPLGGLKAV